MVAQRPFKPLVVGSSPTAPTSFSSGFFHGRMAEVKCILHSGRAWRSFSRASSGMGLTERSSFFRLVNWPSGEGSVIWFCWR